MKNNRLMIILAVVVVGGAVAYFGLNGKFPPTSGTEGAIGAANRYQAGQMSDADVALKDADVQAFLQSDLFHQLATNADFRACVKDEAFGRVAEFMAARAGDNLVSAEALKHRIDSAQQQLEQAKASLEQARTSDALKGKADAARQIEALNAQVSDALIKLRNLDAAKLQMDAKQVTEQSHQTADAKKVAEQSHQTADAKKITEQASQTMDAKQVTEMAKQQTDAIRVIDEAMVTVDAARQRIEGLRTIGDAATQRSVDDARQRLDTARQQAEGAKQMIEAVRATDAAHTTDAAHVTDAAHMADAAVATITDGLRTLADNASARALPAEQLQVLVSAEFSRLMQDPAYRSVMADQAFRADAARGKVDTYSGKKATEWATVKSTADQKALLDNANWAKLVGSDQFATMMSDYARSPRTDGAGKVIALVSSNDFARITGGDFAKLASDGAVLKLATSEQFKSLMEGSHFTEALRVPAFDQLLSSHVDLGKFVTTE
jgi:hypothetical protein